MSDKPECVVLVVHGVGNQEPGDTLNEFQAGLLDFLNRRLRRLTNVGTQPAPVLGELTKGYDLFLEPSAVAGMEDPISAPVRLRLREFFWADLDGDLAPSTSSFLGLLGWELENLFSLKYGRLRPEGLGLGKTLLLYRRALRLFRLLVVYTGLATALAMLNNLFRGRYNLLAEAVGVFLEYVGDISQMDRPKLRTAVNQRLNRVINETIALDRPRFLVLVSHSLGNVFVCDQVHRQLYPAPLPLGWISVGSPLWVMPMLDDGYKLPSEMKMDLALGWHNIYDPRDPLGGPIYSPDLSNPTEQWCRQHWVPLTAHTSYFQDGGHLERLWEVISAGLEQERNRPAAPITVRAPLNRRPLALGPYPRHGAPDELAVWTAHWQTGPHQARLLENGTEVACLKEEVLALEQRTHLWRFGGLKPSTTYRLELSWWDSGSGRWWRLSHPNQQNERLTQGPTGWDLTTPKPLDQGPWRFLFASCHHPFHVHWDGLDGNWFIRNLVNNYKRNPEERPDALFFIGDQMYADDWWEEHLLLPWHDQDERLAARLATYADCYRSFWNRRTWGDLLRLAPSYMMWDDHDIRDGWGSNVHDFVGDDFSHAAKEKFAAARRAFELFQTCGNPPAASGQDYQFTLDWGPVSFFFFDPRTHRRYRDPVDYHPFGPDQMRRYQAWLNDAGQRAQVLVVVTSSPTAFIKSWRLNLVSEHLCGYMRWAEKYLHAEAFDDDLRDQLPNRVNARGRDAIVAGLAGVVMSYPPGAKRACLMAGDVHVGAHSRIKLDQGRAIDLWTASPISNIPNWKLRMLAALALPGMPAGNLNGQALRAASLWTKSARNVVSLSVEPHPDPSQAPLVRGELIYESGVGIKSMKRVMG